MLMSKNGFVTMECWRILSIYLQGGLAIAYQRPNSALERYKGRAHTSFERHCSQSEVPNEDAKEADESTNKPKSNCDGRV